MRSVTLSYVSIATIERVRQRFVEVSLSAALNRQPQAKRIKLERRYPSIIS